MDKSSFVSYLLDLADRTEAPESNGEFGNVSFFVDGWEVVIFYDCGEIDYIDSFVSPDGEIIDVWSDKDGWLDPRIDDRDSEDVSSSLMRWRGVGSFPFSQVTA